VNALGRAVTLGGALGAVVGGLLGTAAWPVVGTFFAGLAGLAVGAAVGLANGITLAAVLTRTRSRWAARFAAAATSLACAVVPAYLMDASPRWDWVVPIVIGAVLAGVLGPFAAFGAQPVVLGRRLAGRSVADVVGRFVATGAAVGAGLGGITGLMIGVRTYLPTAPFAAVEGGTLGSVSGIVLALLACAAIVGPRLRVRS
jgi:hypothetical protein